MPAGRIEAMWFGWEPPQISSLVAREYGVEGLFREQGFHRINQSVTAVIYPSQGDSDDAPPSGDVAAGPESLEPL